MSTTVRQHESDYERPRYSIGEVSERSGLSRDTLRWYERIGLMDYVGRNRTGQRRFSDRDLDWLRLIGKLRRTGMTVADMVRYAELVREGDSTFPQRLEMFRDTRAEVLARIADLQQTVAVLDCKIALYEGNPTIDWRTLDGSSGNSCSAPSAEAFAHNGNRGDGGISGEFAASS
ncbi:MerR family transcriptional regulator [Nocardia uniformis]|uniref:MerR family transcriptional regulator n=1 Tax=Nocardia uniformis TaxID=53432 RepID=A0A849CEK3_9NOCA|nr:MerR family transcriptional regulator [Nocardia uniformis]NNH75025.1 MerR family transcriptional regulator [Nocardia uniformis]